MKKSKIKINKISEKNFCGFHFKNLYVLALASVIFLFSLQASNAADGSFFGNAPDVMNKQYQQQLKDQKMERTIIETTESDIDRENKLREQQEQQQTIVKENLTYNPKFKLNKVIFVGNTVISDRRLQKLVKDKVGKEIYLQDVLNMTIEVSNFYHKNGYITSYAYLDEQEIKDGVVQINIKESRVVKKECVGNKWERKLYLNKIVLANKGLNQNDVFNARTLQGAMKTINNSGYMQGAVELKRNENKDTEIKLHVEDRFPVRLDIAWDNFGRNYTGRQRFTAILGMDNLTGFGDKIYGGTILSQDSAGALAGYEIPISPFGTKLAFDYSYSNMNLGGPYRDLRINGRASDYILRLTQPIKHTATQDVNFNIAFDWVNAKSESAIYGPLSDYSLRVLRTSLDGMFDDRRGRTIANIGLDIGIDGLGATESIKGVSESSFYKIVAMLARVQRLPKNVLGIVRINGQYSWQSLFPVEQMFLGGAYSLRGYQPSELLGDYGIAGSVEFRTPIPGIKALFPRRFEDDWARRINLVLFYDWGYVNSHNGNYDAATNFLHSVGVGTNINITDGLFFQIGVGFPLSRKLNEHAARLYFSLNSELDRLFLHPKSNL